MIISFELKILMRFKLPKNDSRYHWTNHIIAKMMFYGLTPDRVKRVLRTPKRSEKGVAENTVAVMQPSSNSKKPSEIWTMYQKRGSKFIMITAWRYPGISPIREEIPIPADILRELRDEGLLK